MKSFSSLSGIAALLLMFLSPSVQAASPTHTGSGDGTGGGGNNPWVILSSNKGLQIMDFKPVAVKTGTGFLARLASGNSADAKMKVLNQAGDVVWQSDMALTGGLNTVKFKVQNLQKGVYFLHIESADGQAVKTFVVK